MCIQFQGTNWSKYPSIIERRYVCNVMCLLTYFTVGGKSTYIFMYASKIWHNYGTPELVILFTPRIFVGILFCVDIYPFQKDFDCFTVIFITIETAVFITMETVEQWSKHQQVFWVGFHGCISPWVLPTESFPSWVFYSMLDILRNTHEWCSGWWWWCAGGTGGGATLRSRYQEAWGTVLTLSGAVLSPPAQWLHWRRWLFDQCVFCMLHVLLQ